VSGTSRRAFALFVAPLLLVGCSGANDALDGGTTGNGGAAPFLNGGSSTTSGAGGALASAGVGGTTPSTGGDSGGSVASAGTSTGGTGGDADPGIPLDAEGGAPFGPSSTRFEAIAKGSVEGATHGYWEYLPPHYGNGAKFPLLVFLHGKGEWGNGSLESLQPMLYYGIPKLLTQDAWPEDRTFVVLSPQHEDRECMTEADIASFTAFALEHYDVNAKRVYLTGLSCGGIGIWNYLAVHADEVVAAVVPISGDGRPAFVAAGCDLGRVPVWAFHGGSDEIVDTLGSTETISKLQACTSPAAVEANITVYPGVGHDAWSQTYDLSSGNDMYAWLLEHHK
jgi:poly(3-hydroxybutyrate) depolymerase